MADKNKNKIKQTVILMSAYYHDMVINNPDGTEAIRMKGITTRIKSLMKYGYKQINNIQIHKPGKNTKGIAKYAIRFETTMRLSDSDYHRLLNEQNKPDEPPQKGLSFGTEDNIKFVERKDRIEKDKE